MAYDTANPPALVFATVGSGRKTFVYSSTHVAADIDTASFITNGYHLGMRVGDILLHQPTSTGGIATTHRVITASSSGPVDLGDGTTIGSTTNTD